MCDATGQVGGQLNRSGGQVRHWHVRHLGDQCLGLVQGAVELHPFLVGFLLGPHLGTFGRRDELVDLVVGGQASVT